MDANGIQNRKNELYVYNINNCIYTKTIEGDRGISAADVEVFWIRREMIFHVQLHTKILLEETEK